MPSSTGTANRGPAAAAANRRAILASAKTLFAEDGYGVPLQAIARHAGVGQGVLYRHFGSRLDLALAVFDENLLELEAIATEQGDDTFDRLWRRLLALMAEAAAFIEMVVESRATLRGDAGAGRLAALLEAPLASARESGRVAGDRDVGDVMLALSMIYGALVGVEPRDRVEAVERAQRLLVL